MKYFPRISATFEIVVVAWQDLHSAIGSAELVCGCFHKLRVFLVGVLKDMGEG